MPSVIPGFGGAGVENFSLARRLGQVAQLAARPAFELRFNQMQNAMLGRLDKEIEAIQNQELDAGATALLDIQLSSLKREQPALEDYRDRQKSNRIKVDFAIETIATAQTFTASSTVSEFDAEIATLKDTIEKMSTPVFERFGTDSGLRDLKNQALETLDSLQHNNFQTQQDIDDVTATLDGLVTDFQNVKLIVDINEQSAIDQADHLNKRVAEIDAKVESIKIEAQAERIESVQKKREKISQLLTVISLAFESSSNVSNFLSESTQGERKPPPGSILNIFG